MGDSHQQTADYSTHHCMFKKWAQSEGTLEVSWKSLGLGSLFAQPLFPLQNCNIIYFYILGRTKTAQPFLSWFLMSNAWLNCMKWVWQKYLCNGAQLCKCQDIFKLTSYPPISKLQFQSNVVDSKWEGIIKTSPYLHIKPNREPYVLTILLFFELKLNWNEAEIELKF